MGKITHRHLPLLAGIALLFLLAGCSIGGGEPKLPTSVPAIQVQPQPESRPSSPEAAVALVPGLAGDAAGTVSLPTPESTATVTPQPAATWTPSPTATPTHPLMIEVMRQVAYPGSELTFENTLEPGDNYNRHVVSYQSEGNKIYALLTVPWGQVPEGGWPVIIFNHGYIPPDEYRTTERYVDYVDGFARSGYIVFRSDYRGHGQSEGQSGGAYSSPNYTADVLNGLSSVKRLPEANPDRIGMWGHSMGGYITLRAMVVSSEIKAGVIWAGVVASYADLFNYWGRRSGEGPTPTPDPTRTRGRWRQSLFDTYGSLEENPTFWASISSNSYVAELSGPVQLHHSTTDSTVPVEFSEILYGQIQAVGVPVELYLYEGDNHNLFANFWTAMNRSIAFFDTYLK